MATTSPFKQQCPGCGTAILIKDPKNIGKKAECPKCHNRFVIEDPSAADGGDLGFFTRGAGAPFARVAFSLNEGEVSEPVRTKFGWHILKAEQKRAADVAPFEQMKGKLEAELKLKKYVRELRQKASVEVKM